MARGCSRTSETGTQTHAPKSVTLTLYDSSNMTFSGCAGRKSEKRVSKSALACGGAASRPRAPPAPARAP